MLFEGINRVPWARSDIIRQIKQQCRPVMLRSIVTCVEHSVALSKAHLSRSLDCLLGG